MLGLGAGVKGCLGAMWVGGEKLHALSPTSVEFDTKETGFCKWFKDILRYWKWISHDLTSRNGDWTVCNSGISPGTSGILGVRPHWADLLSWSKVKDAGSQLAYYLMILAYTFKIIYPLVMTNIAMERSTIFNGKIYYIWSFSIAMLNYQRVSIGDFDVPWFSTGRFGSAKRIQEVGVKLVRHGWSCQVAEDPATYSGWKWAKAMHIQPPSSIEGNQVRFNGAAPAVPKGQHGVVPGMPRWLAGNANDGTVGKPWLFRDAAAGNLKSPLINGCIHKGASDLILGCVICAVPQVLTRLCFTYSEYFMTVHD